MESLDKLIVYCYNTIVMKIDTYYSSRYAADTLQNLCILDIIVIWIKKRVENVLKSSY